MRGAEGDPKMTMIKDLLLDTGTEEIMHVEMLSTMIGLLLSGASPEQQAQAAQSSPSVQAVLAGMNPQHMIVSGLSAMISDSNGNPWSGSFITASGNIAAVLYVNAISEMHGRLQASRVYELTNDPGIRDTISFMLARDLLHQEQWLAAIEELGGPTAVLPIPGQIPASALGKNEKYAYAVMAYAQNPADTTTGQGRWAKGPAIDGKGEFSYIAEPFALGMQVDLPPAPAKVYDSLLGAPTGPVMAPKQAGDDGSQSIVEKVANKLS